MDYLTVIASVPAIVALVNFCKRLGLKGEAPMVAAVALGIAINVANFYLGTVPVYQQAVSGLMLGLAAAGLYDVTRPEA
jgi:membrane associated rhomboid family serine protease